MDINNVLLHDNLNEEIYIKLPASCHADRDDQVCQLRKSIFRLHQVSHNRFHKLKTTLKRYGFVQSFTNYSLFNDCRMRFFWEFYFMWTISYLLGITLKSCAVFKTYLNEYFHIKDLGALKFFLHIDVKSLSRGLFLCEQKYAFDIIVESLETGLLGAKSIE